MIATLDFLERKFNDYNTLCFEGMLQPIPFKLSKARTFLGQLVYVKTRKPFERSWHFSGFAFRFNAKVDLPVDKMEDILLHEMIHYWILSNQMQDTRHHGQLFRAKMREINKNYGRHITITHRATPEELNRDTEVRQHFICVSHLRDGRCGITIPTHTRLHRFWSQMKCFPNVTQQKWVVSLDPYFNRYPRCLTPKIYPVPSGELDTHLGDAMELVKQGKVFTIKNTH